MPVRVRRLVVCPCQGPVEAKSFGVLDLGHDVVAPEMAYVTARYAALVPFGKVAILLSELLPTSGAPNAGTVRNRTRRVGEKVVRLHATEMTTQTATPQGGAVVVGLDGGHVRSRHRQEERHFEVIAGKVIDADGTQHRFAFARNGQAAAEAFAQALTAAGVHADTPATVLCDGDAELWRLQRETLPAATVVLDWWHVAVRFVAPALQAARGLGAGAANADLADQAVHSSSGRNGACGTAAGPGAGTSLQAYSAGRTASIYARSPASTVFSDTSASFSATSSVTRTCWCTMPARRRQGEPISTAFVESAVNEIVAKRMNKKQQMRWNRTTVQHFSMFVPPY